MCPRGLHPLRVLALLGLALVACPSGRSPSDQHDVGTEVTDMNHMADSRAISDGAPVGDAAPLSDVAPLSDANDDVFGWDVSAWSACSDPCGGGRRTRSVQCKREDGLIVEDSYCQEAQPAGIDTCNTQTCCPSGYTRLSKPAGDGCYSALRGPATIGDAVANCAEHGAAVLDADFASFDLCPSTGGCNALEDAIRIVWRGDQRDRAAGRCLSITDDFGFQQLTATYEAFAEAACGSFRNYCGTDPCDGSHYYWCNAPLNR